MAIAEIPPAATANQDAKVGSEGAALEVDAVNAEVKNAEEIPKSEETDDQEELASPSALLANSEIEALLIALDAFRAIRDGRQGERWDTEYDKLRIAQEGLLKLVEESPSGNVEFAGLSALEKITKLADASLVLVGELRSSLHGIERLKNKIRASTRLTRPLSTRPFYDDTYRKILFYFSSLSHGTEMLAVRRRMVQITGAKHQFTKIFRSLEAQELRQMMRDYPSMVEIGKEATLLTGELDKLHVDEVGSLQSLYNDMEEYARYVNETVDDGSGRPTGVQADNQI